MKCPKCNSLEVKSVRHSEINFRLGNYRCHICQYVAYFSEFSEKYDRNGSSFKNLFRVINPVSK